MTISYRVGNSIYLNITNRCTNACEFCIRANDDGVYGSDSLWLEREPEREEILENLKASLFPGMKEIVFCGYGEPFIRLEDVVWLCGRIKKEIGKPVRINTNGQSDLIHGRKTAPLLKGIVDTISISLNAPDRESYNRMCKPECPEQAFDQMISFAKDCVNYIPNVVFSVVDCIPPEEIERCKKLAAEAGIPLRIRSYEK